MCSDQRHREFIFDNPQRLTEEQKVGVHIESKIYFEYYIALLTVWEMIKITEVTYLSSSK